jgi:hypothetical protein
MKNIRNKMQNFYKRWNIEYKEEKRLEDFRNRVLTTINMYVVPFFDKVKGSYNNSDLWLLRYFKLIGINISRVSLESPFHDGLYQRIFENYLTPNIKKGHLWEIIFYLETLLNFELDIPNYLNNKSFKEILYLELAENIDLSLLDIKIKKTKDTFIIYPAGVKLLDENVVNEVIDYLNDYPLVQKHFMSALQKYQERKYDRNIIDDLRFSLELLLRNILNNKKVLENQISLLGPYLKSKNAPAEIINMFMSLINYYKDYQNEHAKHGDKVREAEIEFMIYLTGTIMRFLLSL